jgi:hypothetical protein
MSLIQSKVLRSGLIVHDAAIKITGLEYDEMKLTARIKVETYKDLATSQIVNSVSLQTDFYDLPNWDKTQNVGVFILGYNWLQTQPEFAGAIFDELWLEQQAALNNQPIESDGYLN